MRTAAVRGERNGERLPAAETGGEGEEGEREGGRDRERERERERERDAPSQGWLQASPTCPRNWKKLLPSVYAT